MRKFKFMAAISLSAVLAAGIISFSSFAEDPDKVTIFVDSDKEALNPGDTVNISVVLAPGAHVSALTLDLLYDTECFEFQSSGSPLQGGMGSINSDEPGKIVFSYMTIESLFNEADQTVLVTALFKVLKPNGSFRVAPETIGSDDYNSTDITEHCVVKETPIGTGLSGAEESGKPDRPTAPFRPSKPDKPTEPSKPDKPAVPGKPTEPVKPSEPDKPTKSAEQDKSTEPGKPAEPLKPTEPGKSVQPAKPTDPGKFDKPTGQGKSAESRIAVNPGKNGEVAKPAGPKQVAGTGEAARASDASEEARGGDAVIWVLMAVLIAAIGAAAYVLLSLRKKRVR